MITWNSSDYIAFRMQVLIGHRRTIQGMPESRDHAIPILEISADIEEKILVSHVKSLLMQNDVRIVGEPSEPLIRHAFFLRLTQI